MLKTLNLAIKFLWREWRAGEWLIVFFALFIAVSASTGLHFYIDRLMRGLDQESIKFLGGDVAIRSSVSFPKAWTQKARLLQLHTAEVWSYPSVVSVNDKLQLVNIQAVSETYPLIGSTIKNKRPFDVWVEPRVLSLLMIQKNEMLTIGAHKFRVGKTLTSDFDALNTGWNIAPRVLIRLADVPATQTVIPGSRIDYQLLLTGQKDRLNQFRKWLVPQLQPGQRILDVHDQRFALHNVLERTTNFIYLALLVVLIMSAVAIAMSIQQYMRRHYSYVALWRCLGAKEAQIKQLFFWQLTLVAVIAGGIGIVAGYSMQSIFANLFTDFLQFNLPVAGIKPIFLGFITSMTLLYAFAFPVILELPKIPPLFIWRNEIITYSSYSYTYIVISIMVVIGFLYWSTDFSTLILFFIDILFISIALLYAISLLLLKASRSLLDKTDGSIRRGIHQLLQYSDSVSFQFVGFTLILILLLTLNLIRTDILIKWQSSLPPNTPNNFAFNIAPSDVSSIKDLLQKNQIAIEGIYPMTRGRLVELNGKRILSVISAKGRANNALHRELNLSWMWQLPSDNKIVQGYMWSKKNKNNELVSVERNLADDLQLHLGDKLTFQIGEQKISAKIANFRSVEWGSFYPNFFMIFLPGLLDQLPTTYITSFHLKTHETNIANQLIKQFPNITIIDVSILLKQIQDIVNKISYAIQYLFLFAFASGVLIFVTSLQASMDERCQAYYLLRVLGASRKFIYKSIFVEFGILLVSILFSSILISSFIASSLIKMYF